MKRINWLDHIANLLVVVLGISIAFYLDQYSSEKRAQTQEKEYLEGLAADLDADIAALDTLIKFNDLIIEATVSLIEGVKNNGYEDLTKLRNDVLIIQYNPPFVAQRTIYESLKASGKMDLIKEFDLRNQLVELYEQYYRGTSQYDQALDDHVSNFIKPFFMENVRFNGKNGVEDDFFEELLFQNMIYSYRYLYGAKNQAYKNVRDRVLEVRAAMQLRIDQI